jgi:predicted RNase H-like HicB family nuclease
VFRNIDLSNRNCYLYIGGAAMREAIIYKGEYGWWIAECPSLPGCISQGKTKEDAIFNIKQAIDGYISCLQEDGLPVPPENFDTFLVAV